MTHDTEAIGISDSLIEELGLPEVECLRDEVLVLGVRQAFKHLATPAGDDGPMDHPTKGITLLCGPKCAEQEIGVTPGMMCYFAKFAGTEIEINNRRFFIVKGSEIKAKQRISVEDANKLARNPY